MRTKIHPFGWHYVLFWLFGGVLIDTSRFRDVVLFVFLRCESAARGYTHSASSHGRSRPRSYPVAARWPLPASSVRTLPKRSEHQPGRPSAPARTTTVRSPAAP